MKPFDLFNTEHHDFERILELNGELVYFNGEPKTALISNTRYLKAYNNKYMSTDFEFSRGDILYYDDKYWMVITQVGTPRYESYKALAQQIEHDVIFNLSEQEVGGTNNGMYISYNLFKAPAIVQQTSDFGLEYNKQTEVVNAISEIHVFVQDNDITHPLINSLRESNKNHGIVFGNLQYKITGVSTINKGVLDVTAELTTIGVYTDVENGIVWKADHSNWNGYINEDMYNFQSQAKAPDELQTDVGTIVVTKIDATTGNYNGSIAFTWSDDASKKLYRGFNGYKVRLLKGNNGYFDEVGVQDTQDTSLTFSNLGEGNYKAEIFVMFNTYTSNEGSLPQVTDSIIIEVSSGGKLDTPQNLTEGYVDSGEIDFSWDAVSNATSYVIYRDGAEIGTVTATSYQDKGLTESTQYTYQVKAIGDGYVDSDLSAGIKITTDSGGWW